jgi:hypothetical protein
MIPPTVFVMSLPLLNALSAHIPCSFLITIFIFLWRGVWSLLSHLFVLFYVFWNTPEDGR